MPMKPMSDWIDHALARDFAAEKTEAYRLCTRRDGWVERYGPDLLVSYKTELARDEILRQLDQWALLANLRFARVFGRFLPKQNAERLPPHLILGDAGAPLQTTVLEREVCFALDFGAGYSSGLFIDQRENRQFVRQSAPRRLLNCFAYTCAFSVVAGLTGSETLSVDLSKKSLNRGRDNFMLNRLATDRHRFLAVQPAVKSRARRVQHVAQPFRAAENAGRLLEGADLECAGHAPSWRGALYG